MSTIDEDKSAFIPVPDGEKACWIGWSALIERVQRAIIERCSSKPILVVECYPGVEGEAILHELQQRLKPALAFHTPTVFHNPQRIEKLIRPCVDGSKARLAQNALTLPQFFDAERLWHARREIEDLREGLVLIVGCGASLIAWGHVLVYADSTRSEARSRLSRHACSNLGLENYALASKEKLRIASRVDWSVADRWKRPLITHWDFVLELKPADTPTLFDGEAVQRGLQLAVQRPFRFAARPTSKNAPSSIDDDKLTLTNNNSDTNSAWQEESLLLSFGITRLELPVSDLVMARPRALLGDAAFLRFGFNCPLRLSLQDQPVSRYEPVHNEEGWREERVVLSQQSEVIETRRLQFSRGIPQHTHGSVLVLELVEGPKVSVESPAEVFSPLVFHPGQPFVLPAGVGEFVLRPAGLSPDRSWVILKHLHKPVA